MRGKDDGKTSILGLLVGSPPLARERRGNVWRRYAGHGITPACAGKTAKVCPSGVKRRDHPRLRGKDINKLTESDDTKGSPPLARERRWKDCACLYSLGITPACAGKTVATYYDKKHEEDHPRLRGKDWSREEVLSLHLGSPPLARERPTSTCPILSGMGITPACAGKTQVLEPTADQK